MVEMSQNYQGCGKSRIVSTLALEKTKIKELEMKGKPYYLANSCWIDTDGYTDRDRKMFVCGVEFQTIYTVISDKRDWCQCIHTENESRVRMLCAKLGLPVKMNRACDTWTHCEIPASTTI